MNKLIAKDGFSLIELMASMVIMAIVSLNIATMIKNQEAGVIKTKAEYTMSSTIVEIGGMLANSTVCKNNLQNTNTTTPPTTISSGARVFTANPNINTATFYGDGNIGIKSFGIADWVVPVNATTGTASLVISFFKKGAPTQTITKKISLNITTDGTKITDCRSLGHIDPTLTGSGIISCPDNMTKIGSSGDKMTFCIHTQPQTAASYVDANTACFNITETRLGTAHLCDFDEWSKACMTNTSLNMNPASVNNTWEWIAAAPTSTAIAGTPSTMTVIGAKVDTAFSACTSVKVNAVPSDSYPYRCCFR